MNKESAMTRKWASSQTKLYCKEKHILEFIQQQIIISRKYEGFRITMLEIL
jgi:hypothetical protein